MRRIFLAYEASNIAEKTYQMNDNNNNKSNNNTQTHIWKQDPEANIWAQEG